VYAAEVCSRVINYDGSIPVSVVAAKTSTATETAIRLKLFAVLLLSDLIRPLSSELRHKNITVFAWFNSSIVLSWLSYTPAQLETEVHKTLPMKAWRHVDFKSNSVGCASRGLMVADLIELRLCWNEPLWLRDKDKYLV